VNTKTITVRLDGNTLDTIDSKCTELACNRTDFIKSAIQNELNEKEESKTSDTEHKSHHDKYGNYWYWNTKDTIWTCKLNPENLVPS